MPRATITVSDELMAQLKAYAADREISLSLAVATLAVQALQIDLPAQDSDWGGDRKTNVNEGDGTA